jgi:hypothetical protein
MSGPQITSLLDANYRHAPARGRTMQPGVTQPGTMLCSQEPCFLMVANCRSRSETRSVCRLQLRDPATQSELPQVRACPWLRSNGKDTTCRGGRPGPQTVVNSGSGLGRRNDLRPRTLASPRRYRAATAEFLQVTSWVTADIFMREIPGGTRARHRSRPADLPEHRYRPQRSERAGTFRRCSSRAGQVVLPRPQLGDQPVAVLNRAFVTRSPSRTTL